MPRSPSSVCFCSGRWPTRRSEPVVEPASARALRPFAVAIANPWRFLHRGVLLRQSWGPGARVGETGGVRGTIRLAVASLVVALVGPSFASAADRAEFDAEKALERSQSAIGVQLDDFRFVDTRGRTVDLGDSSDKPLVLSLVYTSCPDTCSVVTRNLARAVRAAREALGETSFSVATVGFDPGFDTPEQMRLYADRQGVSIPDWRFLSGDPRTIERLLDQVGFTYLPSPRGFDHLAQTTVIDAHGRIYRQVYGDAFAVPALVEPLKDLALGRPAGASVLGDWMDRVKLLCTVYDPAADRYRFDYSIFVAASVGLLCLGGLGVFIVRAWRESGRAGRSA